MTRPEADEYRPTGVWPGRPMTPFEPLPAPRPPQRSRARRTLAEIAWRVIVVLALLSGVAYVLAKGTGQI
jgi:hypothetical protein